MNSSEKPKKEKFTGIILGYTILGIMLYILLHNICAIIYNNDLYMLSSVFEILYPLKEDILFPILRVLMPLTIISLIATLISGMKANKSRSSENKYSNTNNY